jgi:hypothetical protein
MKRYAFGLGLLVLAAAMPAQAWQTRATAKLPAGLVAWWSGDGNATDAAGQNAGKIIGGVSFAPGMVGQGFLFDGMTGGIEVPDADALKVTGSLSISAWVKLASYPAAGSGSAQLVFRGHDRDGHAPYSLAVHRDGLVYFGVDSGSAYADVSATIPVGRFFHIAATLDDYSGRQRLYLDGHVVAERITSVRPFKDLDPRANPGVGIGNTQNPGHNGQPFHGIIDEVRIYSRVLPPSEIQALARMPAQSNSATASRSPRPASGSPIPAHGKGVATKKPPTRSASGKRHGGPLTQAEIDTLLGVNAKSDAVAAAERERSFREDLARNGGRSLGEIREAERREAARRADAVAHQAEALRDSARVASVDQGLPVLIGRRSWWVVLAFDDLKSEIAPPDVRLKFDDASTVHLTLYDGFDGLVPNLVTHPTDFRIPPGPRRAATYYAYDVSLDDAKKPEKVILRGPGVGKDEITFPIPK